MYIYIYKHHIIIGNIIYYYLLYYIDIIGTSGT